MQKLFSLIHMMIINKTISKVFIAAKLLRDFLS